MTDPGQTSLYRLFGDDDALLYLLKAVDLATPYGLSVSEFTELSERGAA